MNPVVTQIENGKLILNQSGFRMVLDASQAQQLLKVLQEQVPQVEALHLQKMVQNQEKWTLFHQSRNPQVEHAFHRILDFLHDPTEKDEQWSEVDLDGFLYFFDMNENGELCCLVDSIPSSWTCERLLHLWTSIASSQHWSVEDRPGIWWQLWWKGCFDSLLRTHCATLMAKNPILEGRLLSLSEVMQWMDHHTFWMGDDSLEAWDFEQPVHQVTLSKGIWIGRYPVSQQLYHSVMGMLEQPTGAMKPVVGVTWFEAIRFCNALSQKEGRDVFYQIDGDSQVRYLQSNGYRLLTEAEWECAARAGQQFVFSGSSDIRQVGWTQVDKCIDMPTIGQKNGNGLDLFDMSGLIWEWCQDWYDAQYYHHSPGVDPLGPNEGEFRVCRGGSYLADPDNAKVSLRGRLEPHHTWTGIGFRICCFD